MTFTPAVSVLLPVYNGAPYLADAIQSILNQIHGDWEMVIINDGSVDASAEIIGQFQDARIRYFDQENRGLAATLNRAIGLARGTYLARQDQDDLSSHDRFHKQVTFLDAHPDVGMLGSWAEIWNGNRPTGRMLAHPTDDASLKFHLLFDNPFVHSSIMIRRCILDEVGGYSEDPTRQPPEDYELWSRVARRSRVANLPETLIAYREVQGSMSRTGDRPFVRNLITISAENIARASGRPSTAPEVIALARLHHRVYDGIPRGVRWGRMIKVLQKVARCIAEESGVPCSKLEPLMRRQRLRISYLYCRYRCGRILGGWMQRPWGCRRRSAVNREGSVRRP